MHMQLAAAAELLVAGKIKNFAATIPPGAGIVTMLTELLRDKGLKVLELDTARYDDADTAVVMTDIDVGSREGVVILSNYERLTPEVTARLLDLFAGRCDSQPGTVRRLIFLSHSDPSHLGTFIHIGFAPEGLVSKLSKFSGVRTFEIGHHLWWVLHYTDGVLSALEEHDMRAGGHISRGDGRTWEEEFLKSVAGRVSGDATREVARAKAFLAEVS